MNWTGKSLNQRITTLRWLLPIVMALVVIFYQLAIARWVHDNFNMTVHFAVEIIFFSATGPLAAFWVLTLIGQWFEEKQFAEKHAQENERRLASITTASADAIIGLDEHGIIESWNHGAELIFGYSSNEVLGKFVSLILGNSKAAEVEGCWLIETTEQKGYLRGHETTCQRANGRELYAEITATHISDTQGKSIGMSVVLRDITNRKHREEEIRRLNASLNQQVAERTRQLADKVGELAEANQDLKNLDQMRTEFVSLVSHQIRAPLTNVRGAVERMQTDCNQPNSTCKRMFTILEKEVNRLNRLVQDVLSAARIETGELALNKEPLSVLPVLRQVVEQISARISDRQFHVPEKPGLPLGYGDRDRLTEILLNLLDNADKYSPLGEDIYLDIRADQTEITLSVSDFGPGLDEGAIERVFDKFFRADSGDAQSAYGYGLGLYVCRLLVEAQGGSIWAKNRPGGGTTFSFTLPVWQREDV